MPENLILVRHGQSEGNVASKASREGNHVYWEHPDFSKRHSSWWRLTNLGVKQAEMAGKWLQANAPAEFDGYYVSAYTRAMETAAYLDLPSARWFIEPRLREREYGHDELLSHAEQALQLESIHARKTAPLYWRPLNGESIADCIIRVRNFLETLSREYSGKQVIVVCHGEIMDSFRVVIERMTHQQYIEWKNSDDPFDHTHNGQVFQYSRKDPGTGIVGDHLDWFRSVSTSDLSLCDPSWKKVARPVYNNKALLEEAHRTPRLIADYAAPGEPIPMDEVEL